MPVDPGPNPYEVLATAVAAVIADEFSVEGFTAIHDMLHESLGQQRVTIGISPEVDRPMLGNRAVTEHRLLVQFYDFWKDEISPDTQINPLKITGYAERFKRAVKAATTPMAGTPELWYYDVDEITYPLDPTGNKSRFHAIVRAYGNNTNLIETTG